MSTKIQALQAQARAVTSLPATSISGVDVALRPVLVKVLRATGKFSEVSAIADTRSGVKVYLALRGTILNQADYRVQIEEMARKAGIALSLTLTSGSAYQKRFRVNVLRTISAQKAPADLFGSMQALAQAPVVKGQVVIEGTTFNGMSADAIRQITAIVQRENLVEVRLINVNNMQSTRMKVPVVVRDAITGKTPRFAFAGRWTVMTTQGLTVLAVDGSKYVLAD